MTQVYKIFGSELSPYSVKVRSYFRYKRVPHEWVLRNSKNEDEFRTDYDGGFIGMSFRFFDPETKLWSIYWADTRRCGVLDLPVFGSFSGDVGVFEGDDTFNGRPIRVRFSWSGVTTPTPRWEQAFSDDGGETWETNWVMEFTPAGDRA